MLRNSYTATCKRKPPVIIKYKFMKNRLSSHIEFRALLISMAHIEHTPVITIDHRTMAA